MRDATKEELLIQHQGNKTIHSQIKKQHIQNNSEIFLSQHCYIASQVVLL